MLGRRSSTPKAAHRQPARARDPLGAGARVYASSPVSEIRDEGPFATLQRPQQTMLDAQRRRRSRRRSRAPPGSATRASNETSAHLAGAVADHDVGAGPVEQALDALVVVDAAVRAVRPRGRGIEPDGSTSAGRPAPGTPADDATALPEPGSRAELLRQRRPGRPRTRIMFLSTSSRWRSPCRSSSPMYIASKRQLLPVFSVVASSSRIGTGARLAGFCAVGFELADMAGRRESAGRASRSSRHGADGRRHTARRSGARTASAIRSCTRVRQLRHFDVRAQARLSQAARTFASSGLAVLALDGGHDLDVVLVDDLCVGLRFEQVP